MSNGSILHIPIQINGGTTVPNNLLERELFIKNGELYVGNGNGGKDMIIGRVVNEAVIKNPTISTSLTLEKGIVIGSDGNPIEKAGKLYFIDEGNFVLKDNGLSEDDAKQIMDAIKSILGETANKVGGLETKVDGIEGDYTELTNSMNEIANRVEWLEEHRSSGGGSGQNTSVQFVEAKLENEYSG